MPADHKVSIAWQIVALFVPIANFWAFYRIRKLQKYLLYVYLPSIAASLILVFYMLSAGPWPVPSDSALSTEAPEGTFVNRVEVWRPFQAIVAISYAIGLGFLGLSIYLVVRWSREHNQHFAPTAQT